MADAYWCLTSYKKHSVTGGNSVIQNEESTGGGDLQLFYDGRRRCISVVLRQHAIETHAVGQGVRHKLVTNGKTVGLSIVDVHDPSRIVTMLKLRFAPNADRSGGDMVKEMLRLLGHFFHITEQQRKSSLNDSFSSQQTSHSHIQHSQPPPSYSSQPVYNQPIHSQPTPAYSSQTPFTGSQPVYKNSQSSQMSQPKPSVPSVIRSSSFGNHGSQNDMFATESLPDGSTSGLSSMRIHDVADMSARHNEAARRMERENEERATAGRLSQSRHHQRAVVDEHRPTSSFAPPARSRQSSNTSTAEVLAPINRPTYAQNKENMPPRAPNRPLFTANTQPMKVTPRVNQQTYATQSASLLFGDRDSPPTKSARRADSPILPARYSDDFIALSQGHDSPPAVDFTSPPRTSTPDHVSPQRASFSTDFLQLSQASPEMSTTIVARPSAGSSTSETSSSSTASTVSLTQSAINTFVLECVRNEHDFAHVGRMVAEALHKVTDLPKFPRH